MSTHPREARSKEIVKRVTSLDGTAPVLRVLECGHVVYEPRGGAAKRALRAHCPVCAPRRAKGATQELVDLATRMTTRQRIAWYRERRRQRAEQAAGAEVAP